MSEAEWWTVEWYEETASAQVSRAKKTHPGTLREWWLDMAADSLATANALRRSAA